jgi:hypothetical protein
MQRKVSLSLELDEQVAAIDGARMLADALRNDGLVGADDVKQTAAAISGMLSLLGTRIRDLGRALRGSVPAEAFWARHNASISAEAEVDDVILPVEIPTKARRKTSREPR